MVILMRFAKLLLLAFLMCAGSASCAHPQTRLVIANTTEEGSLVRISEGAEFADFVYAAPTGVRGLSWQALSPFDGRVELLNDQCEVISHVDIAGGEGSLLLTFSDPGESTVDPIDWTAEAALERVERCDRR